MSRGRADIAEIERFVAYLAEPGDVIELRALEARQGNRVVTVSGYFDQATVLAAAAAELSGKAAGVYVTLNRTHSAVLSRRANRTEAVGEKGTLTSDNDIVRRTRLLIDCDAVRPRGIASTEAEHEHGIARARDVRAFCKESGWPDPLLIDSGNGAHLIYGIDLPVADAGLVKSLLKSLSGAFSDANVTIDQTVHNPARITKLCGTLACKGENSAERPHRLARILEAPETVAIVTSAQIEAVIAATAQPAEKVVNPRDGKSGGAKRFDLPAWLQEAGIEFGAPRPWNGGTIWELATCPWNNEHRGGVAWAAQFPSGALAAGCHHNSCSDKHWADLRQLVEGEPHSTGPDGVDVSPGKRSQASELVRLVHETGVELFHSPSGDPYMSAAVEGHREVLSLRSGRAGQLLRLIFYRNTDRKAAGSQVVTDALNVLRSQAVFDGPQCEVCVRVARHDEDIYLDMGDENWSAVRINANGWEVVTEPPVRFRRAKGMLGLAMPRRGGRIADLRRFLNVTNDDDFRLMVTVLICSFFPAGPYPVVLLQGEQGSAKSTTARVLAELLDPAVPALRAQPREGRDLMIAANNRWLLSFDNMSELPAWLSDALCRLATGGGFSTRELYTDDDEALFDAQRPVILTGIEDLVARSDLLDRTILFILPHITEESRETEASLWSAFEEARPFLLGAVLDCLVQTLRVLPELTFARLPRLADFAVRGAALAPSLGWTATEFFSVYEDNRHSGHVTAIEASSVAQAVVLLMDQVATWNGTATELLESLNQLVTDDKKKARNWPKNARGMSGALKRIAPNLRELDITVEFLRSSGRDRTRQIEIRKASASSEPSESSDSESTGADVHDTPPTDGPPFASEDFERTPDGADGADGADSAEPAQSQFRLFDPDDQSGGACRGCGDGASLVDGLCGRCRHGGEQ